MHSVTNSIMRLTSLQVGVKKGGSIKLLREYFHQKCTIIGVDVDKACPQFPYDAHIKIVLASSTDSTSMQKAFKVDVLMYVEAVFVSITFQGYEGQVDVIIDDGLHRMGSVEATFLNLWPLLSPNGIYLLEDIHRDVDLHDSSWRVPFHTMDPNTVDSASFNNVQVQISKINSSFTHNLLQRFEDSSEYEVLWAIYPPRSIAPELSLSILSVTDCCAV